MTELETGDKGQRYEVRAITKTGEHIFVGWAETMNGAEYLAEGIRLHPCFYRPKILDRQEQSDGE